MFWMVLEGIPGFWVYLHNTEVYLHGTGGCTYMILEGVPGLGKGVVGVVSDVSVRLVGHRVLQMSIQLWIERKHFTDVKRNGFVSRISGHFISTNPFGKHLMGFKNELQLVVDGISWLLKSDLNLLFLAIELISKPLNYFKRHGIISSNSPWSGSREQSRYRRSVPAEPGSANQRTIKGKNSLSFFIICDGLRVPAASRLVA